MSTETQRKRQPNGVMLGQEFRLQLVFPHPPHVRRHDDIDTHRSNIFEKLCIRGETPLALRSSTVLSRPATFGPHTNRHTVKSYWHALTTRLRGGRFPPSSGGVLMAAHKTLARPPTLQGTKSRGENASRLAVYRRAVASYLRTRVG